MAFLKRQWPERQDAIAVEGAPRTLVGRLRHGSCEYAEERIVGQGGQKDCGTIDEETLA